MGTKMGMHNRITEDRYRHIKQEWAKVQIGAHNDNVIAKRCGISKTTASLIRRTDSYHEYRLKTDKRLRKPIVVIAEKSGLPYEDFGKKPIFSSKPLMQRRQDDMKRTDMLDKASEKTATMIGVVSIGWIILLLVFGGALLFLIFKTIAS